MRIDILVEEVATVIVVVVVVVVSSRKNIESRTVRETDNLDWLHELWNLRFVFFADKMLQALCKTDEEVASA